MQENQHLVAEDKELIHKTDPDITGCIVGPPRMESIIVPRDFVEQLAVVLGRPLVAVESERRDSAHADLDRDWFWSRRGYLGTGAKATESRDRFEDDLHRLMS